VPKLRGKKNTPKQLPKYSNPSCPNLMSSPTVWGWGGGAPKSNSAKKQTDKKIISYLKGSVLALAADLI